MTGSQPKMRIDPVSMHLMWYCEFLTSTMFIVLFPDNVNRTHAGHSSRTRFKIFFLNCGKIQGNSSVLKFNVYVLSSQYLQCGEPLGKI